MVLLNSAAMGQIAHLALKNQLLDLPALRYSLADLRDLRTDTTFLGTVKTGPFNVEKAAKLKGGNQKSLANFLSFNFAYVGSDSFPVYLAINHLRFTEGTTGYGEYGSCELTVSFYLNQSYSGAPYYVTSTFVSDTAQDVFPTHINRLHRVLKLVLEDFNNTFMQDDGYVLSANNLRFDDAKGPTVHTVNEREVAQRKQQREEEKIDSARAYFNAKRGGRNVVSLGYQIGGWTLVGVNFEYRLSDLLGVHAGGGITGVTAGLNFHTSPSKNSLYISPNFKDGGFGLIGSFCLELGGRIPFTKKSYEGFGLQLQGGLQQVLYIDPAFQEIQQKTLGSSFSVGTIAFSMGIGFSF